MVGVLVWPRWYFLQCCGWTKQARCVGNLPLWVHAFVPYGPSPEGMGVMPGIEAKMTPSDRRVH